MVDKCVDCLERGIGPSVGDGLGRGLAHGNHIDYRPDEERHAVHGQEYNPEESSGERGLASGVLK